MASYPASSSFSSLQQLLTALATLITEVSHRQENAWVLNTELNRLFCDKYGESIDTALNAQVSGSELRNLLCHCRSPRFRVRETSNPKAFHIRLFDQVTPDDGLDPKVLQSKQHPAYQPILLSEIQSTNDLEYALIELIKSLTISEESTTLVALANKFRACYGQHIRTIRRSVCSDMQLSDLLQTIPNLHVKKIGSDWQIQLKLNPNR